MNHHNSANVVLTGAVTSSLHQRRQRRRIVLSLSLLLWFVLLHVQQQPVIVVVSSFSSMVVVYNNAAYQKKVISAAAYSRLSHDNDKNNNKVRTLKSVFLRTSQIFLSSSSSINDTSDNNAIDDDDNENVEDCDIVIFGGGFGGVYTALAIHNLQQEQQRRNNEGLSNHRGNTRKQRRPYNIVVVEPTDQFVFLPLLYDFTVGTATEQEVCPSYTDLFQNTNIRHIRASLESIRTTLENDSNSSKNKKNGDHRSILATIRLASTDRYGTSTPATPKTTKTMTTLRMKAAIIAVGASPDAIIASVPGATGLVQPFYTAQDAKQTRRLLNHFEKQQSTTTAPKRRIAVIGGGYGGVELSASIQRRLPEAQVHLLCRGPPMANTRAESLVEVALTKLGVVIEPCNVIAIHKVENSSNSSSDSGPYMVPKINIQRTKWSGATSTNDDDSTATTTTSSEVGNEELPWDAVLWTAGSGPADPISTKGCDCLQKSSSGRIAIDATLRCLPLVLPVVVADENDNNNSTTIRNNDNNNSTTIRNNNGNDRHGRPPKIWALGDCAEVVETTDSFTNKGKALPKTAQVAMQQADTVAANVLSQLLHEEEEVDGTSRSSQSTNTVKTFAYQDLGSMLTLGGPNGAVLAPNDDTPFGPLFAPLLDVAGTAFGITDSVLISLGRTSIVEQLGIPTQETLGLSFSSYGLGVTDGTPPKGTLAGTLAGAARRTVYAVRMPTNQQRAVSLISATIATAAALIKESTDRQEKK